MFETYAAPELGAKSSAANRAADDAQRIRNICVYCGSRAGADPAFVAAGKYLGTAMARGGIGLIYGGGGGDGLMGTIARAALSEGGRVTAIIPAFLKEREDMLESAHETIIVDDMHERKRMMFERADAFVALPGGVGTLEELVEQMTWRQLDRHAKPVVIADINGFWQPLLALFGHMGKTGFVQSGFMANYHVSQCVTEILPLLCRAPRNSRRDVQRIGSPLTEAMDELENSVRHDRY
jgi:uncharacterized protein (TIGR00730 family)